MFSDFQKTVSILDQKSVMTLAREKWFLSGFNGFTCLWTSSHYFAVCPAAKRGLQICLREVAQSLSLKPKEVGDCIQCVLARISHAVVALFMLWPTIKEGVGGALNPCGFVGYDLPCVQVTEPLLPKHMLCLHTNSTPFYAPTIFF